MMLVSQKPIHLIIIIIIIIIIQVYFRHSPYKIKKKNNKETHLQQKCRLYMQWNTQEKHKWIWSIYQQMCLCLRRRLLAVYGDGFAGQLLFAVDGLRQPRRSCLRPSVLPEALS